MAGTDVDVELIKIFLVIFYCNLMYYVDEKISKRCLVRLTSS